MTIEQQNLEASQSTITREEIAVLFQGERRDVMFRTRDAVWSEANRMAYRAMRMEDACV